MAEQIISPGVFTRENDLSFLPQGIGQIGAAIIGPTEKGPAFVPTVVRSFSDFERRFGPLSSTTYVPQTVLEYLKNAGSVTVCRVLAGGGYTFANGTNEFIVLAASGSEKAGGVKDDVILGVLYPSQFDGVPDLKDTTLTSNEGTGTNDLDQNFNIVLSGSGITRTPISASVNPANKNYLFKRLGDKPSNSKNGANQYTGTPAYTYKNWKNLQTSIFNTVAESTTITFGTTTDTILTASLQNIALSATGAFYFSVMDVDGPVETRTSHTLVFSGSGEALGGKAPTTQISGSVLFVALDSTTVVPALTTSASFADISTAFRDRINTFTPFNNLVSASSGTSDGKATVTLTQLDAGATLDMTTNFVAATASVAIGTQGTNITGYSLSSGKQLKLITQSADMVYSGEIGQEEGYGYASTPFIQSQFLDVNKNTQNLFKFHTLYHGKGVAKEYKVSIANLREPSDIDGEEQYSQFSVIFRTYGDKDKAPRIIEQYNKVTLDPNSPRYISRVIGDRYPQYNDVLGKVELLGNYPNISRLCRVEVANEVAERSLSPKLSPKGFAAVTNPIRTASLSIPCTVPSASYETIQQVGTSGTYNSKGYLGWKFKDKETDNENFICPLPDGAELNVFGAFNVENYFGHASSSLWSGSLSASIDTTGDTGPKNTQLKFTVPFQGGDDGIAPYTIKKIGQYITSTNVYGFDLSATNKAGYKGYKKAIDILSNQDEYDINMLVTPGVIHSLHPLITNLGIDMCEDRGDAFYVMDLNIQEAAVNTAVSNVDGLDTNYAAVYYPWVKVLDSSINKPVLVPPSVIVPGAIAASDRIGAEWFAPAGLNRGILGNVLEAKIRLNQAERDTLYDSKINPIATFPQTGVCIWGQKTLQERSTALDRINVRRLLIALKKFIASSSRYLVFEQNTLQTRTRFLNIVNPYLESVQQQQGLYAFRVVMDESNNTPDVIDRNQLVGGIYLQPTKTAEFIILDFNILPTGATFDTGGGGSAGGGAGY